MFNDFIIGGRTLLRDSKRIYLLVGLCLIICLATIVFSIKGTNTEILINRYISLEEFFFVGSGFIIVCLSFCILLVKNMALRWEQYAFYLVMGTCIALMLFLGYVTTGESIRSILVNDKNDALMDFFNSIQYGMKPYENRVVYPPFINALYGFFGRYAVSSLDPFLVRSSQMGSLVYGMYAVAAYSACLFLIFKIKDGNYFEKFVFLGMILFSAPFLFAYDRGNAILLVLLALLLYLFLYKSDSFIRRVIAYNVLGIAAGIKIFPAIFGVLLFRERKWQEILLAVVVGLVWFFVPFVFTDGNVFTLVDNIRNTDNIRDIINLAGYMENVGSGAFVNSTALLDTLGRILNVSTNVFSAILNYTILVLGLSAVLFCKKIAEWQLWTILTGIVILIPGFSCIYTLILFTIPLILFLNSKPEKNKINMIAILCYIGIFVPLLNYPISLLNIFLTDWHPATISSVMESSSVLLLVLLTIIIGTRELIAVYWQRTWFKAIAIAFTLVGFGLGINAARNVPLQSFYCANMKAGASVSGFLRENGQYLGINADEASIHLKCEDILQNGLLLSFGRWDNIKSEVNEDIAVFINNEYVAGTRISGMRNQYIFIPAGRLQKYGGSEDMYVTLVRQEKNAECVPMLYVGPAVPCESITNSSMIHYATMGMEHGNESLKIEKEFCFLCENELLSDGLFLKYYVPEDAFNELASSAVLFNINGVRVAGDKVRKAGDNVAYVSMGMLPVEIQEKYMEEKVLEVGVEFESSSDADNFQGFSDMPSLIYIGEVPELSSWQDISFNRGYARIILSRAEIKDDLNIFLDVKENHYKPQQAFVEVSERGYKIGIYSIYPGEELQAISIPREHLDLVGKDEVLDLEFKVLGINGENNDNLLLAYVSSGGIESALREPEGELAGEKIMKHKQAGKYKVASVYKGLAYDTHEKLWYMGEKGTFFLRSLGEAKILHLKYMVNEYLLLNSHIVLDLYVNGEKMYAGLPCVLGENDVNIPLSEEVLAGNDGCIQVTLASNRVYNLKRLHISRLKELGADRSIGIKYAALE